MFNNGEAVTPFAIQKFLTAADPGKRRLVYFVGNLGEARVADRSLAEVAREAYAAAERGECSLVQKRFGRPEEGNMLYLIERRGL